MVFCPLGSRLTHCAAGSKCFVCSSSQWHCWYVLQLRVGLMLTCIDSSIEIGKFYESNPELVCNAWKDIRKGVFFTTSAYRRRVW